MISVKNHLTFKIPDVNFAVNIDNKVGACGFYPIYPFVHRLYPVALVKVNEVTGEVVRGPDGMCLRCKPGEHGEMVGKIIRGNPVKEFSGYLSHKETSKKLLRNVFSQGDVAFSSGYKFISKPIDGQGQIFRQG